MRPSLHSIVARHAAPGPGKPPLLLLLHGVGSNERDMARLAPALDARFLVLAVRAPHPIGPDAFGWFNVRFTPQGPAIDALQAKASWEALSRFISEAVATNGADPSQVFLAGFSQGGIMALAATLTTPHLVAGAVCMSGRLLPEVLPHAASPAELAGKPVLVVHGTTDAKLGIDFARQAQTTLEGLGVDLAYHELPMGHEVTAASLRLAASWLGSRSALP